MCNYILYNALNFRPCCMFCHPPFYPSSPKSIFLVSYILSFSTLSTRHQPCLTKGQYANILGKLISGRRRHMETDKSSSSSSIPPSLHPSCWRNSQPSLQVASQPRPAEHVFSSPGRVNVRSFIHSQWYSGPGSPACMLIMRRTLATDDEFNSADRQTDRGRWRDGGVRERWREPPLRCLQTHLVPASLQLNQWHVRF